MARLIPSFMDDRTPPGERDVFNLLAAGPEDWVALHSLDLAPWNRGLRTEIDFVLIVPDSGILCIEVKSHENLSFDGYRWRPETITRSPFKQAQDGRYAFHRRLAELVPKFRHVPVVHCCIFPRSWFDLPPNLSVQPWELMDMRAFRAFTRGDALSRDLRTRVERSIAADSKLRPLSHALSRNEVDEIVESCVPVQKRRPDAREQIVRREEELERILRSQQKSLLQLGSLNERLIVSGGAGTGKTLIAMEVARRAAEGGRRTALLCFNQLVGDWMKTRLDRTEPRQPNLIVGRAIRVMAEMAGIDIPKSPPPSFWDQSLPLLLEERLTNPEFKSVAEIDYLVLDEAQDLLARPPLWHCLAQFISKGLEGGAFALFGDFDHQVLADPAVVQRGLQSLYESGRVVRWRLTENCRNYRIVGDTAVRLAGLGNGVYSEYLRSGGGLENYDIFFFEHDREQLDKLAQLLREFRAQGYKPSEIVLLSCRSEQMSAAIRLKQTGWKLRPAWQT
jgi:hypothetical protein